MDEWQMKVVVLFNLTKELKFDMCFKKVNFIRNKISLGKSPHIFAIVYKIDLL
jgi:hypothetical protein